MENDYIKYFIKFKEDNLSSDEKLYLLNLINSDQKIKNEFLEFCIIWNITSESLYIRSSNQLNIYKKLLDKIDIEKNKHNIKKLFTNILKYAAILIIGSLLTLLFYKINEKGEYEQYITFSTKPGSKSFIILPDSSKVWLNSASKIVFSSNFKNRRFIKLDGEAYFEVMHKRNIPFKVITSYVTIDVIGTKFNVKSYSEDKTVETTLIQGKIKIRDNNNKFCYYLNPDQKAIYNKNENKFIVQKNLYKDKSLPIDSSFKTKSLQVNPSIAWKENILFFDNEPFEEIVKKLERWYGYEIYIADEELLKYRYRGRFTNNETIYQVLEAIKYTTPIEYSVHNNKIKINKIKKP